MTTPPLPPPPRRPRPPAPPPPPPPIGGRQGGGGSDRPPARANTDVFSAPGHTLRPNRSVVIAASAVAVVAAVAALAAQGTSLPMFGDDGGAARPGTSVPSRPAGVACGGEAPAATPRPQFEGAPKMRLKPRVDYQALIHTPCGDMKVDLLEKSAPIAVNNFVFLAREGFYDGLPWHQIVYDFIIQTGDPNGHNAVPPDGPGYTIRDEPPRSADVYTYGTVGMANKGRAGTSGSQFFIVVHDYSGAVEGDPDPLAIRPRYTIFGHVRPRFYGSVETIARLGASGSGAELAAEPVVYVERVEIIASRGHEVRAGKGQEKSDADKRRKPRSKGREGTARHGGSPG